MFDLWPSVIIKKQRINDYNGDASVEVCYIQAYKNDSDVLSSSTTKTMNRAWVSVCIEHNDSDIIRR